MQVKIKIKDIPPCKKLIDIEVPHEEVTNKFEEVYRDIARHAKIAGFRPGHAPIELVKKQFSDTAKEEVIKRLISDAYLNTLEKNSLRPIGHPQIDAIQFEDGKPFSFKAAVEVYPEAVLKTYKGLKVDKKKAEVLDAEFKKAMENLLEAYAQFIPVIEKRPIKDRDYIIADVDCFVKEKCIEKKENSWMYVIKDAKEPNLTKDLVGKNIGDTVTVDMKLPENFSKREYKNQDAQFVIKIKEIRQKNLPALNDEFAKDAGRFKTLQELEDAVKKELLHKKEYNVRLDMENQIIEQLLKNTKMELPQTLVQEQSKHLFEESLKNLTKEGLAKEELDLKRKELEENCLVEAQDQLKVYYIFDKISEIEKIEVNDSELNNYIELLIKNYHPGQDTERLKQQLKDEDYEDAKLRLRNKKVMDLLLENAAVEEVE